METYPNNVRPATAEDFNFFFGLYMHPAVNPWLLYEPMSADAFRPIFDDLFAQSILYVFEKDGVSAGMFKLAPLKFRTEHVAYLGGLAIDPVQSGKGLGAEMMAAILQLAQKMGLLRIELSTATNNARAIRLYEKMGFEREGVLRKYTHLVGEGRFLDELLMSYLFPPLQTGSAGSEN